GLRELRPDRRVPVEEVREAREDDRARHALRQRLAERRRRPEQRPRRLGSALLRAQADLRPLAITARDAVDDEVRVGVEESEEAAAALADPRERRLRDLDGFTLPGDAADSAEVDVTPRRDDDRHRSADPR